MRIKQWFKRRLRPSFCRRTRKAPSCPKDMDDKVSRTIDKLECEIDKIQKDNEGLKKEMQDLKSAISRLENSSGLTPINEEKFSALGRQVEDLRSFVSKLQVNCPSSLSPGEDMEKLEKENVELKKNITELTTAIHHLKDASSHLMGKEEVKELDRKNVELKNKIEQLSAAVNHLESGSVRKPGCLCHPFS